MEGIVTILGNHEEPVAARLLQHGYDVSWIPGSGFMVRLKGTVDPGSDYPIPEELRGRELLVELSESIAEGRYAQTVCDVHGNRLKPIQVTPRMDRKIGDDDCVFVGPELIQACNYSASYETSLYRHFVRVSPDQTIAYAVCRDLVGVRSFDLDDEEFGMPDRYKEVSLAAYEKAQGNWSQIRFAIIEEELR